MNKITIMNIDKENLNGNIFTREAIEEMVKKCKNKSIPGYIGMNLHPKKGLDETSHLTNNIKIIGDKVVGDIIIREGFLNGDKLKSMLELEDIVFRAQGEGVVDEAGIVNHFNIDSINAIDKSEDAV